MAMKKRPWQGALFLFVLNNILIAEAFARAGGGGGGFGGGGGGFRGGSAGGGLWIIYLIFGLFSIFGFYAYLRVRKLNKTRYLLQKLGPIDQAWDENKIKTFIENHFSQTQKAWSTKDLIKLKDLIDNDLLIKWEKKINKMIHDGESNVVSEIEIFGIDFIDIKNYINNDKDRFTVEIRAKCKDETIDSSGEIISSYQKCFTEYWTYIHRSDRFILKEIDQVNGDVKFLLPNINEVHI